MPLKISIITAVYNNSATIEDALLSVASQTYRPIEHIVIDGNSNDGTKAILDQYRDKISILVSESDTGIYNALNKGLKLATGDVIGLLHSDDIFADNNVVENIINAFETDHPDGVYGDLQYVAKDNTKDIFRYWQSSAFHPKMLRRGWMPPHPTLFLSKNIIAKTGYYNERYRIAADYDFMLRTLSQPNAKFKYIPKIITKMRTGGASNRSIKNIIFKMWEDYLILRRNNIGGMVALLIKNFSKLKQFVKV
jgi:glycosyltransferase